MPAPSTARLYIPTVLQPSKSDELRWSAIKRHYETGGKTAPTAAQPRFGACAIPVMDLANYIDGKYENLSPSGELMFFRKTLLLLVGNDDLLRSVVEHGRFRGSNVDDKLDDALDECLMETASQHKPGEEREFYMNCIIQMRTNRKQQGRDKWRDRLRALFIFANGVFFVGWIMGYWSYGTPPWASEATEDNPDAALADWMRNDPSGGGVGAPEFVQFST